MKYELNFIDSVPIVLQEIKKSFGEVDIFEDNFAKELVKDFLTGVYKNFEDTIKKIESTLDFTSNRVDYNTLKDVAEKLKEFIEKNKKIFIAAGIMREDEVNKKVMILEEKKAMLNKFLTH